MHTTTSAVSTKNQFLYSSLYYSLFHHYFLTKSSLQSPLILLPSIPQQLFTSLFLRTTIPVIYTKNISPTPDIKQSQTPLKDQGAMESCEEWPRFNLSLLPQSMDSDSRVYNQWFLVAQAQKVGVLQVVVSDEDVCNWNSKPSNPPSLIPSLLYCHYFYTLLIPSQ